MHTNEIDGVARDLVESSAILSLGYVPHREVLAVELKSGAIYHYLNVPADVAMDFYNAGSKGQFYAAYIRGKFTSEKMTGLCNKCRANGVAGTDCACGQGKHYKIDRTHGEPPAEVSA